MSRATITLDSVLEKAGFTERWEARGEARGREEGWKGGLEKTARNLLARGFSLEVVCDVTGLDRDTVSGLVM